MFFKSYFPFSCSKLIPAHRVMLFGVFLQSVGASNTGNRDSFCHSVMVSAILQQTYLSVCTRLLHVSRHTRRDGVSSPVHSSQPRLSVAPLAVCMFVSN